MEAFSLLKYWRNTSAASASKSSTTTPILTTASPRSSTSSSDNDEGPYFDLEFSLPEQNDAVSQTPATTQKSINDLTAEAETETDEDEDEENGEISLSISSSSSSYDSTKEHLHSNETEIEHTRTDSTSTPKLRTNLFKSASKFRVLMALKLKKLKENASESENKVNQSGKLFTVKFIKVEEAPIVSLFSRDSSSKSENRKDEEEKRFTKDVIQRYMKMMKPLYVRASKRYGEKINNTSTLVVAASPAAEVVAAEAEVVVESGGGGSNGKSGGKSVKERNLTAGLRVVRKHLGKSKSASAVGMEAQPASRRRDDSLIQQEDGIQSAIMHCKRSFNSSRESSVLLRSSSHQPVVMVPASATDEEVV